MSFRTDVRAGVMSTLNTYAAANPSVLRGVHRARPASLSAGELPCAWIEAIDSPSIVHSMQIRQTNLIVTVTLADVVPDSDEQAVRADTLVDGLEDALTADFHSASGNAITEPTGYAQRLVTEGPVPYAATDYYLRAYIGEGRI